MVDLRKLMNKAQRGVTKADENRKRWIIEKSDGEIKKIGEFFDYSKADKYLTTWRDGRDLDMLNITVLQQVLYNNLLFDCYTANEKGKKASEKEFITVKKRLQEIKKQLENDIIVAQNEIEKINQMMESVNSLRSELCKEDGE